MRVKSVCNNCYLLNLYYIIHLERCFQFLASFIIVLEMTNIEFDLKSNVDLDVPFLPNEALIQNKDFMSYLYVLILFFVFVSRFVGVKIGFYQVSYKHNLSN